MLRTYLIYAVIYFFQPLPFYACSIKCRGIFRFLLGGEGRKKEQNEMQHCFLHRNMWDLGIIHILYKLKASIWEGKLRFLIVLWS